MYNCIRLLVKWPPKTFFQLEFVHENLTPLKRREEESSVESKDRRKQTSTRSMVKLQRGVQPAERTCASSNSPASVVPSSDTEDVERLKARSRRILFPG